MQIFIQFYFGIFNFDFLTKIALFLGQQISMSGVETCQKLGLNRFRLGRSGL